MTDLPKTTKKTGGEQRKPSEVARLPIRQASQSNQDLNAKFGAAATQAKVTKARRGHPIANKLIKKMNWYARAKVVDLKAVMTGRKNPGTRRRRWRPGKSWPTFIGPTQPRSTPKTRSR